MRYLLACLALLAGLTGLGSSAQAGLDIKVNLVTQTMQVATDDGENYQWKVSSGAKGYRTPTGVYRPYRLEKKWYSRKYGGNMPSAVFFRGGYAIHGTGAIGRLGSPASHGCIRLHPANAAKLFSLVQKHGKGGTRIALNGVAPDSNSQFAKAKARKGNTASRGGRLKAGGANWDAARDQLFLRPGLPAAAYGFQPVKRMR
jgi:L,D-transpeptidase catalytic domain